MSNAAVFKLIVPSEDVKEFFDWKECVAFRFVDMGDGRRMTHADWQARKRAKARRR